MKGLGAVVSVRLRDEVLRKIDKLVEMGYGRSRNEVLNKLIVKGLEAVTNDGLESEVLRILEEGGLELGEGWLEAFMGER